MKKINLTKITNNKKLTKALTAAGILAVLGWGYYVTTRPVVGVIDFNAVQMKAKVYQSVLAEQQKHEEAIRVRMMSDTKDIEADAKSLDAKKDKMKLKEYQEKLNTLQQRAFKVQNKYKPFIDRILLSSQIALKGAEKEIALAIEKTAQDKHLRVILSMNNALYATKSADVTDTFVKNLDKLVTTVPYPDPNKLGQ